MNSKFPVLSFVSILLRGLGWITVIGGLLYGIGAGIIEPNQTGHRFGTENYIALAVGVAGVFSGLLTVALGESIGVLFAIEENTRTHH